MPPSSSSLSEHLHLLVLANFCELVVDQIMQCNDGANQRSEINHQHLIVCLDVQRIGEIIVAYVGKEVEDVLQLVSDLMIDGHFAFSDLLQVILDVAQLEIQSLQTQQLVGDFLRQAADSRVFNIAQQMLDTNFFSLFGSNLTRDVFEGLRCGRSVLMNLLNGNVCFSRQAQVLWLSIDDHQNGIWAVAAKQLIDCDVVLMQFGAGVIPSHDSLAGIHLLEHTVHGL